MIITRKENLNLYRNLLNAVDGDVTALDLILKASSKTQSAKNRAASSAISIDVNKLVKQLISHKRKVATNAASRKRMEKGDNRQPATG